MLGGGLAGLVAAARLGEMGVHTILVTRGSGSLPWQTGNLGPGEALPWGREHRKRALTWWLDLTQRLGIGYSTGRLLLPTARGEPRRIIVAPASLVGGHLLSPDPVLVAWPAGHRDFLAHLMLSKINTLRAARDLPPWAGRPFPAGLRGDETAPAIARLLATPPAGLAVDDFPRVGLPAVLGLTPREHHLAVDAWQRALGRPVFELPTLPPCLPGCRLERALRGYLRELGVEQLEGYQAILDPGTPSTAAAGGTRVEILGPGRSRILTAGAVVVATGDRLTAGGWLTSNPLATGDRLFPCGSSLPQAPPPPRGNTFAVVSAYLAAEAAAARVAAGGASPPGPAPAQSRPAPAESTPTLPQAIRCGHDCYGCQACTAVCPAAPAGFPGPRAVLSAANTGVGQAEPRTRRRGTPGYRVRQAELCLGCLQCLTSCPASSPGAAWPARPVPGPRERLFSHLPLLSRLAGALPGLVPRAAPLLGLDGRTVQCLVMRTPSGRPPMLASHGTDERPGAAVHGGPGAAVHGGLGDGAPGAGVEGGRNDGRPGAAGGLVLLAGCYASFLDPSLLAATRALLADYPLRTVRDRCCGAPALALGHGTLALRYARSLLEDLLPAVRRGWQVVTPCPTCALALRLEYPLLGLPGAAEVARATIELGEFLRDAGRPLVPAFAAGEGKNELAYHQPCHTRAQGLGTPWVELLRGAGFGVRVLEQSCCGQAGVYGFLRSRAHVSGAIAADFARRVAATSSPVATECPMCLLRVRTIGATGRHPAHLLAISRSTGG